MTIFVNDLRISSPAVVWFNSKGLSCTGNVLFQWWGTDHAPTTATSLLEVRPYVWYTFTQVYLMELQDAYGDKVRTYIKVVAFTNHKLIVLPFISNKPNLKIAETVVANIFLGNLLCLIWNLCTPTASPQPYEELGMKTTKQNASSRWHFDNSFDLWLSRDQHSKDKCRV